MTERPESSLLDIRYAHDGTSVEPLADGAPVHPRWRIHPLRAAAVAESPPRRLASAIDRHPVLACVSVLVATMVVQFGIGDLVGSAVAAVAPLEDPYLEEVAGSGATVVSQLIAAVAATAFVLWLGWWRAIGLTWAGSLRHLYLLWVPVLTLVVLFLLTPMSETVDGQWLAVSVPKNMLTGYVEEVVVRGVILFILLRAWRHRSFGVLRAVVVSSLLFGAAHLIGLLGGGNVLSLSSQAIYATFLGVGFAAVLVRTNTIWPLVVLHGLINVVVGDVAPKESVVATTDTFVLGAIILVVPLLVHGLVLVRRRRRSVVGTSPAAAATQSA
ncbi:MAG: lysostaphin resistance A-like protein [Dermatophilaceae bacterium]